MTRAPSVVASSTDLSEEPLSAMTISPAMPILRNAVSAFSMQILTVRSSFKQGMTAETRIRVVRGTELRFWSVEVTTFIA
jgi:hypothetical protein